MNNKKTFERKHMSAVVYLQGGGLAVLIHSGSYFSIKNVKLIFFN